MLGLLEAGYSFSTLPRLRTKLLIRPEDRGLKARAVSVPTLTTTPEPVRRQRERSQSFDEAHLSDLEDEIHRHVPTLFTGTFATADGSRELVVT